MEKKTSQYFEALLFYPNQVDPLKSSTESKQQSVSWFNCPFLNLNKAAFQRVIFFKRVYILEMEIAVVFVRTTVAIKDFLGEFAKQPGKCFKQTEGARRGHDGEDP